MEEQGGMNLYEFVANNPVNGSRAGGVGGLLMFQQTGTGADAGTYFPTYDGNGNVTGLVTAGGASPGTVAASYEYGPFGNLLRMSGGQVASDNPFRFSSKWQDSQSDLYYYGYRFYNADTGRWANRDPLQEQGEMNFYGFIGNDCVNTIDPDGEKSLKDYIANGITGGAEIANRAFSSAASFANAHPSSINLINALLAAARPTIAASINLDQQTLGWTDLGAAWLFELGPVHWTFGQDDATTADLKMEDGVNEARAEAIAGKKPIDKIWLYDQKAFYTGVSTFDWATSFTGSYEVKVIPGKNPCILHFEVDNESGWASGTRLRKATQSGGVHQSVIPDHVRGAPGTVSLGGTIDQTWKWQETK